MLRCIFKHRFETSVEPRKSGHLRSHPLRVFFLSNAMKLNCADLESRRDAADVPVAAGCRQRRVRPVAFIVMANQTDSADRTAVAIWRGTTGAVIDISGARATY